MIEIERKFLVVSDDFIQLAFAKNRIAQGYLNTNPARTVRVRIKGNQGFLTIKGVGNISGLSRYEWEKNIDVKDAMELLKLCEKGIIKKIRYEVMVGKNKYEIDVFEDENHGLTIAEIELESETEVFEKPDWLGEEVTGDKRYYNAHISLNPYCNWDTI